MKQCILILAVMAAAANGQITINSASYVGTGVDLISYSMTSLMQVGHGQSGGNQTWSFPAYQWSVNSTTHLMSPSGSPYAEYFPSANLCGQSGTNNTSYSYSLVSANSVTNLGFAQLQSGSPLVVVYHAPEVLLPFPLSSPHSNWTSVATWTVGSGQNQTITTDSTIHAVDGWGTMVTQFGSQAVLRTFNRHWSASNGPNGAIVFQWVEYAWLNTQGIQVVSVSSDYDDVDPNFSQGYISMTTARVSDAPPLREPLAESFTLNQNYPNPFNPSTTISFSLPRESRVTVEVFDALGRLIAVPSPEAAVSMGNHQIVFDGTNLASGIYFARVTALGQAKTVKMEMLK